MTGKSHPIRTFIAVSRRTISRRRVRRELADLSRRGALIVDTETTDLDGVVVEIGVIDLATGAVVAHSLVHPGVHRVSAEAGAVHGITTGELSNAPQWAEVAQWLRPLIAGRPLIAYNANFDDTVLQRTCQSARISPLTTPGQWWCASQARRRFNADNRLRRLGGNHRSLGDCHTTRDMLLSMLGTPQPIPLTHTL